MSMTADDPKRPEKFREFAAIYGRFDCKRKAEKPLTLHEVSAHRLNGGSLRDCAETDKSGLVIGLQRQMSLWTRNETCLIE